MDHAGTHRPAPFSASDVTRTHQEPLSSTVRTKSPVSWPASLAVVIGAFAIAFLETSASAAPATPTLAVSAVGLWIVLASVFVPAPPASTLAMAVAAASTWPLAYAINVRRLDLPLPAWQTVVLFPVVNYLMAGVAYRIARRRSDRVVRVQSSTPELGSYRLLARIGEGGMGEVWKASHQMLARRAAIKLVRPTTSSSFSRQADMWIERFRREANVIAGLQSPHTIYLYDFGVSRDGQFYYVMELLDGISLQTLVTSFGPQSPARVRSILLQICESLEEAHQQGLIHRDLKPSNVMLCKVALTHDFIKVLDFGLAKCAACEEDGQLTQAGTTTGTPGYIAPEVALGEPGVDGRADVYALGCVAYYLLSGTLVFPDSNPMSMALKHVQAKPEPLSSRAELPVPADLERIVMSCLEKAPASRPASARELARALVACDLPAWTEEDAAAWWERHLPPTSSLRVVPDSTDMPAIVERA
jgi:serine/threonine-protein kinase